MSKSLFARWQANFWAGLAIVLPAIISVAVVIWLFGTIANITDLLLFFLPREITHHARGEGPMHWYWSLAALLLAICLIGVVGLAARNYLGKRFIEWVDSGLLRVPLLNKIYSAIKQVNDAFSSGNKTAFRTLVMVEFPGPGIHSLGFLTGEQRGQIDPSTSERLFCVFVPTTPNPTSGFLVLVPERKFTRLDMSVADGIKYIVSLGSIMTDLAPQRAGRLEERADND